MLGGDRAQTTRRDAGLQTEFILVKDLERIRNHYVF